MPTPQDYAAQDASFMKQAAADKQSQAAQEALKPQGQEGGFASFISPFMMSPDAKVTTDMLNQSVQLGDTILNSEPVKKARDLGAGAITGATNIADSVVSLGKSLQEGGKANAAAEDPQDADAINAMPAPTSPIWDHAKAQIMDFRDAVAVKDPTMADQLVQGVGQLAIPFAGFSRGVSLLHGFANLAVAGAATDATAVGAHDPRMADLFALGRHTEGKLGDTLRAIAPDGGAVNAYVNFLTDRSNETEAEGRFKNVLDGFGVNAIATPLIHAAATTLKYGMAGLRTVIDQGVPSPGRLGPTPRSAQGGYIGYHGTNAEPFATFSDDKIGGGEGNQSFGYGHYLTDTKAIAANYGKNVLHVGVPDDVAGQMMHWDRPLSEQPEVARKLGVDLGKPSTLPNRLNGDMTGQEVYSRLSQGRTNLGSGTSAKEASAFLAKRGITGIRYLDAASRNLPEAEQTHNSVLFDPKHAQLMLPGESGGEELKATEGSLNFGKMGRARQEKIMAKLQAAMAESEEEKK